MTSTSGEKRKHSRFTGTNLRIILKDDKNYRGETIRDISLGGIFVRMENPFDVGVELLLTIDPKLGLGEVTLKGVVVWRSGEDASDKGVGIRFTEMPARIEEKLKKFFKTLKKI